MSTTVDRNPDLAPGDYVQVGSLPIDSGHVELGDCGEVYFRIATDKGDGWLPVFVDKDEDGSRWIVIPLDPDAVDYE